MPFGKEREKVKLKTPIKRSLVIITIILLSVLIGIIYDSVWKGIDRKSYPREYSEYVEVYSEKYGVPEYVIYGVIKYESNFDSGYRAEDGGVGLMGLSESEFDYLLRLEMASLDSDSRYGPETSIKYGSFLLAHLHAKFGSWDTVLAAKTVPVTEWEEWLRDSSCYDEEGVFVNVPDPEAMERGEKIAEYVQKYREMYYD